MKRKIAMGMTAIAISFAPVIASAQEDASAIAAKFGALEDILQVSMSADGNKVAMVTSTASGTRVGVADMRGRVAAQRDEHRARSG